MIVAVDVDGGVPVVQALWSMATEFTGPVVVTAAMEW